MQSAVYEKLDQKPYESYYLHVATTIDHPVEKIWPHALNIASWMTAHRLETIDGKSGRIGHFEKVFPRNLGADTPPPHHHLYGVAEIIAHEFIGIEVFPEKGGSYGNKREWMSFDGIFFTAMGSSTKVVFHMVDVHMGKGDAQGDVHHKEKLSQAREMIKGYFGNLRRLVDDEERNGG